MLKIYNTMSANNKKLKRLQRGFCLSLPFFIYAMGMPLSAEASSHSEALFEMQAQRKNVKGHITDESGLPVIGANISVKGHPGVGVISDLDGNFILNLPEGERDVVLIISFIGYGEKQISVKGGEDVSVVLSEDTEMLQEVQVIAYGSQKKVTVTGSVSSVNTDDIVKTPVASLGNALSGKLPGLSSVQMSGKPGGDSPDLYVRGDANPLVLVDGVERSFFDIDPNEVENVTVLKDASSTAVFGVRGANGVILVTTKRGEKGKAKVNVTSSFGIQTPTRLLDFTDSYDYATFYNEAVKNDNPEAPDAFLPDVVQAFKDGSNPLVYPNMDWMDYLLKKTSFQTQHNVNISGGSDKMRYFISTGFLSQDGLFKTFGKSDETNFKFKRYNYRANLDFDLSKSTALKLGIGGRVTDRNAPLTNPNSTEAEIFKNIYWAPPFGGAGIDEEGRWIRSHEQYFPLKIDRDGLSSYYGRGYMSAVNNTLNMDVDFTQKLDFITKGLSVGLKGAYNSNFTLTKKRSLQVPHYTPVITPDGEVVLQKEGDDAELSYDESTAAGRDWYAELRFNYKRTFGKHDVSALALYNQSKNYYPTQHPEIPRGYVGLVGRVTYNYAMRYMLDFNMGYNGSENFANGHRFGFLPAVSGGWIVSEEKFMKKLKAISYMKLRASYGVVGNDKVPGGRFLYLPDSYAFGGGYNFGVDASTNQPGAFESRLGNPTVTWELAYKQNYGIDVNFFKDRLKVNFDYFFEKRKNQLITRGTVPLYVAMNLPAVNLGERENKGFEIMFRWDDKINEDWRYFANVNLAYARNKIVNMDEVRPNEEYMWHTGQPQGQNFGRKFWGFYDETANERYKQQFGSDIADHGLDLQPGDCVYIDLNKDGVIDSDDVTHVGYPTRPEFSGAFSAGFTYKNFEISMLWNFAWNTSRYLQDTFRIPFGATNTRALLQSMFDDRWTPETASTATLPRASFASKINNYADSDLWLADASYLRLKNIEIAYKLNIPFLKKAGIKQFRIFGSGYNLLTIDKLKIADPESNTGHNPEYPVMKVFNLGLRVGF